MKKITFVSLLFLMPAMALAQSVSIAEQGAAIESDGVKCSVEFYAPGIVRIVKYPSAMAKAPEKKSLSVVMTPQKTKVYCTDKNGTVTMKTAEMTVGVDKKSGTLTFMNAAGREMLKENGQAGFAEITDNDDRGSYRVSQSFALDADEPIYGLGNLENGKLSQRGLHRTLMPGNVEDGIPYFTSVKGYGVFWDNYSPTDFNDADNVTTLKSEVGKCVDYYFMCSSNADGVVAQMRTLTGNVPMMPLWTYGFWQSRERYKSADELLQVVSKYRALKIPIDGIVQDWQYWGNNYLWNAMEFLNGEFARPQQMIDSVHAMNAHIIISIWSSFGPKTKAFNEMNAKGMLFDFTTWPESGIAEQWPPRKDYPSGVKVYDAYNPAARDIYWNNLTRLNNMKIDGWWMDSTEPDHIDAKPSDFDTKTFFGTFRSVRGAYPLMTVGGVYDHQRAATPDKRVFILTRSGFAGQQRYGCNVWSGDVASTWESLRNQIPAGLNFSLTGNPNFNSDLGGFFAGSYNQNWNDGSGYQNPAYRELYVRWMQFGVFTPMMRSHGTEVPRELYYYGKEGEPIYDALKNAVKLRYALLPYTYSTSWQVTHGKSTFMRALMMDFAEDRKVWNIGNEYMYGSSFLVAPVVNAQYTPEVINKVSADDGWNKNTGDKNVTSLKNVDFSQAKSKNVYLPSGTSWYDFMTGKKYDGGQEIVCRTTISNIPVYVRAGSIIPIGPDVQYAGEKPWDNLTIRVYAGADGSFTLYEDEGDNYNYEMGAFSTIDFKWKEREHQLVICRRAGKFQGMQITRNFNVVLIDGADKTAESKTVKYKGSEVSLRY